MSLQDTILNSLHRAVTVTDSDGKITYWNGMAEKLYGWSAAEAIGKHIEDVRPTEMTDGQAEEASERLRAGKSWEGIVRVRRKDGSGFNAFVADSPIIDDAGDFSGVVGISREASKPLDEQQLLNTVLRKTPIPTAVGGSDGSILSFNSALEELIGYEQSEIIDVNDWAEKLYPDPVYRSFVMKNIGRALQGEEQECSVFEVSCKDGRKKTLEFHTSFFHGGLVIQMVDLTERERIASEREATIRLLGMINAENSLHKLMKLITEYMRNWAACEAVGIRHKDGEDYPYFETRGFSDEFVLLENSLCTADKDGAVRRDAAGNVVLECMCGCVIAGRVDPAQPFFTERGSFWTNSTSELLASTSEEDRRARTRNRCNGEGYESVALIPMRTGRETLGLLQFNDRRRDRFSPEMIAMLERLAENLALGLSQRLAAKALHESEKKTRSILEASTSFVALIDRDGRILDCNEQMRIRFNIRQAEAIGCDLWQILPDSVRDARRKRFEQVLETGKPVKFEDCRDGMWNESVFYPVFDEQNEVTAVTIYANDITTRKQAEEALRESEERFRSLAEMLPEAVFETDSELHLIYANQRAFELFGYSKEDFDEGLAGFAMLVPDDRKRAKALFAARAEGKEHGQLEYRALRKDGSTFPVLFHASSIFEDGNFAGIRGIIVDITEQKRTEEALRGSEDRLKKAERIGRIGNVEFDIESGSIYWSDFMYELYGCDHRSGPPTYEEIMGMHLAEDRTLLEECVRRAIEEAEPYEIDVRITLPNGKTGYHHVIGNPMVENGKVTRIFGTVQDVTSVKQAEKHLQQTLEATTDGIWYWHIPTNTQSFSVRYYTMLGYEPYEFPESYESWVNLMHPDDRERAVAVAEERRSSGVDSYEREFRLRTKNGDYRWIRSKARVMERSSDGEPIYIIGNHEDITERKKAEEELRLSLEEAEMSRREVNGLLAAANAILQNLDFTATAKLIFNRCKEVTGAGAGYVALLNKDGTENDVLFLDPGGEECTVDPTLRMPVRGLRADAYKHRRAACENDFLNSPWQRYIPDGHMRIDNALFAPLVIDDKAVGIIGLGNKEGGFSERDVRNATAFGELSAIALKNSWDLDRLSESEKRFREVFENIGSGVAICAVVGDGEDFVVKDINPAGSRIGGMKPEEHIGKSVRELYPGVEELGLLGVFRYVWRTGLPRHHPVWLYKDDRIEMWVENYICKLPSEELMVVYDDITEKRRTELALKDSEEKAHGIISSISDSMFIVDRDMVITWMNDPAIESFGDHTGEKCHEAFHPDQGAVCSGCAVAKTMRDGKVHENEREYEDENGAIRLLWSTTGVVASDPEGRPSAVIEVIRDITERKRAAEERKKLQDQLSQAQKMESVGRLAGGVAHDFNNMLSVIMGHAEMALEVTGEGHPVHESLKEIYNAAGRSADLTRKLLAFARKQTIAPKILNLNKTIEGMLKVLRRLIGEGIDLVWKPDTALWDTRVDPVQIDQVLANLCVNARDAIENIGVVTIKTGNAVFDIDYCAEHAGFLPGEYVMIAVSDDGSGMDTDTVDRIFEPFFTRKEKGKGTGLGLATVYGIVKQNDGIISVDSSPGAGTTFRIYLPRFAAKTGPAAKEELQAESLSGRETILLVEDEEPILHMTVEMLRRLEYNVLPASTPGEAISIARDYNGQIDLLLTDVIMPEMNGRDLAKNLLAFYPDLKRLYMSGYTADVIAHHGVLDEGVYFIQKPFNRQTLSAKLRETIEGS